MILINFSWNTCMQTGTVNVEGNFKQYKWWDFLASLTGKFPINGSRKSKRKISGCKWRTTAVFLRLFNHNILRCKNMVQKYGEECPNCNWIQWHGEIFKTSIPGTNLMSTNNKCCNNKKRDFWIHQWRSSLEITSFLSFCSQKSVVGYGKHKVSWTTKKWFPWKWR